AAQLATLAGPAPAATRAEPRRGRAKAGALATTEAAAGATAPADAPDAPGDPAAPGPEGQASAPEPPPALAALPGPPRLPARGLALAQLGATTSIRDVALLEELQAAARAAPDGAFAASLTRLVRASELLESNVSPELLLDVLVLRWPRTAAAA